MASLAKDVVALNAICPYFTMFPLDFPLGILRRAATASQTVLDPFCGRGTTNFAARLLGLDSLGVDASPVATAITASKLVRVSPDDVVGEATGLLKRRATVEVPDSAFWRAAYHPTVLEKLCKLRHALIEDCASPARIALRGVLLGALHGPVQKTFASYFSNQCPRTYAPKPAYAVRFWRERRLKAPNIDVLEVVARRASRYYSRSLGGAGEARLADSRESGALRHPRRGRRFSIVVTSPPYYGMRTYIPDQWLRNWFVGGASVVDYSNVGQLVHTSPMVFSDNLKSVWQNARSVCDDQARLVVRFGGISDRGVSPRDIIRASLRDVGWEITTIKAAGVASDGRRQADTFLTSSSDPVDECVVWARAA